MARTSMFSHSTSGHFLLVRAVGTLVLSQREHGCSHVKLYTPLLQTFVINIVTAPLHFLTSLLLPVNCSTCAFCVSSSLLQPAAAGRERGKGGERAAACGLGFVGALNWGISFLNQEHKLVNRY